jgi:hypothetical protein
MRFLEVTSVVRIAVFDRFWLAYRNAKGAVGALCVV